MKIKLKLVLLFLGVSLIPFILVSIIYINGSKNMLKEAIDISFERVAKEKANSIDSIMTDRVTEVELLAKTPEIKDIIKKSNSNYEGRNAEEVMNEIVAIDESWIKSKETNEEANRILNNEASILLREYKNRNLKKYGEIFVSDKNGAAVAMTKTLSDYYQADEQWWESAFNNGEGDVFIDDRGFDASVGALVIGVVVPVKENGEVIGILKINYNVEEIVNIIGEPLRKTDFIVLARSQGDIIASSLEDEDIEKTELGESIKILDKNSGYGEYEDEKGEHIIGYSPIKTQISTRIPSIGEIKGVSGEKWEDTTWFIVIDVEKTEAFLPIQGLINQVVFISWIIIGLISIIVVFIASSISEPIEKLTLIVAPVSKNNFNVKIDKKTLKLKDEIGQLARSFNVMIKKLKTSYSGLEGKVEKRNRELEKMNKFFLNREERIIELKEKIEKLKNK